MSFAKLVPFLHFVLLPFIVYFVFTKNPLPALILLVISVVGDVVGKTIRRHDVSFLQSIFRQNNGSNSLIGFYAAGIIFCSDLQGILYLGI